MTETISRDLELALAGLEVESLTELKRLVDQARAGERRIDAAAAFDKRSEDPKKDYGIHGVEFRFSLVRSAAAVSFGISTGWYLPETVGDEGESSSLYRDALRKGFAAISGPMPTGMYFHVAEPHRDYLREQEPRDCDLLPDGRCWGDVTFTGSDRPFFALVEGGLEAMWGALAVELDAFCADEEPE